MRSMGRTRVIAGTMSGVAALCILILSASWALPVRAQTRTVPFSGRLLDDQAHAVPGPVDLQLTLFRSELDPEPLKIAPLTFPKTELADGVFRVQLTLSEAAVGAIGLGASPTVYLQVKDLTHDRIYQRQKFSLALPEAAPPPAAPPTAAPAPEPMAGSTQGRAELVRATSAACLASQGPGAKFIVYRAAATDAALPCAGVCSGAKPGSGCIRGWTLFNGDEYLEFGSECTATPGITASPTVAHICCCLVTAGPSPLTLGLPAGVGP